MKYNIQPVGERALLKIDDAETTTEGDIVLPDNDVQGMTSGVVVAVGSGEMNEHGFYSVCPAAIGDRVMYGKYAGDHVKHCGVENHLLVRWAEIKAILTETD